MHTAKIPDLGKKLALLHKVGFPEKDSWLWKKSKEPRWKKLLEKPMSEFKPLVEGLEATLGKEGARRVILKLVNPKFRLQYAKVKHRATPTRSEIMNAIKLTEKMTKNLGFEKSTRKEFIVKNMWEFLFKKEREAKEALIKNMLGPKYKFLIQHGFRKSDIMGLLKTPRGGKWLITISYTWMREMKAALSRHRLGSLFPNVMRASLYGRLLTSTPQGLKNKIQLLIETGARNGLSEEKVKALLRKQPHLLIYPASVLDGYLKPARHRTPKARPKQNKPRHIR